MAASNDEHHHRESLKKKIRSRLDATTLRDAGSNVNKRSEVDLMELLLDFFHDDRWPHAVDAEYDSTAGRMDLGRGDLVFASSKAPRDRGVINGDWPACDVLVVEVKWLTAETGPTASAARTKGRKKVKAQVSAYAGKWHERHPNDRVWGLAFLNDRKGAIFDGGGSVYHKNPAFPFFPASARPNERVLEVQTPRMQLLWLPRGPAGSDAGAASQEALRQEAARVPSPSNDTRVAALSSALAGAYLLPTEQTLKDLNGTQTVVAMFGCTPCAYVWWRRVPLTRAASHCHKCHEYYERIPLNQEPAGLGFFHCKRCERKWTSNPAARDVSQPCYGGGCSEHVLPHKLIPSMLLQELEGQRRGPRTNNTHSCAHCRQFGTGPNGRCPLQGRTGLVGSQVRDSAASVASSILSGPSVRQYSPDNIERIKSTYHSRFMRNHARNPLDDGLSFD
jgi:hypothetical protein